MKLAYWNIASPIARLGRHQLFGAGGLQLKTPQHWLSGIWSINVQDSFEWIFFDCFNTLIDDFDDTGDESGLGPMTHLPVEMGFFAAETEMIMMNGDGAGGLVMTGERSTWRIVSGKF